MVWRRRWLGVACLNVLLALGSAGCSSSQQGDAEDLENSDQQDQGGDEGQQGDESQSAENQQSNEGEGGGENFNAEPMENTGNETALEETGEQNAGAQNDLQEIMTEMDQGGQNAGEQAVNQAAAAPVNAAPVMNQAAPAQPMADTSTTSAGGVVGGMAGVAAGAGLPELGSKIPYVVRAGDTLAKISGKIYGSAQRWKEIATLTGLDNPNHIFPGDVIYFQLTQESVGFAQAYLNVNRQEIVVQQGDTLATISKRALGSSRFWKSIWRENDHINNPDQLVVGQTVFYVTEAAMSAAVNGTKDEELITTNNALENTAAGQVQVEIPATSNDFDFETLDMSATSDLIVVNLVNYSVQHNVSSNS